MSHIDEGVLHAWIDGALRAADDFDHAAIGQHLAGCVDCRARLAEARHLRDEASRILVMITPPDLGVIPPFEELAARAAGVDWATSSSSRGHRPLVYLVWAASLVLALGAGWWAHHLSAPALPPAPLVATPTQPLPLTTETAAAHDLAPLAKAHQAELSGAAAAMESRVATHQAQPPAPGEARSSGAPGAILFSEPVPVITVQRQRTLALKEIELPAAAGGWEVVDRAAAEVWAGGPLALIPELAVLEIAILEIDGLPVVRTRQELADGNLLELVQQADRPGSDASDPRSGQASLGRRVIGFLGGLIAGGEDSRPVAGKPEHTPDGEWPTRGKPDGASAGPARGQPGDGGRSDVPPGLASPRSLTRPRLPVGPAASTLPGRTAGIPGLATRVRGSEWSAPDPLAGAEAVELQRDGLLITARALMPPDSVRALLNQIR